MKEEGYIETRGKLPRSLCLENEKGERRSYVEVGTCVSRGRLAFVCSNYGGRSLRRPRYCPHCGKVVANV